MSDLTQDTEAEIINLFPEEDDAPVHRQEKAGFCWHRKFRLDTEAQRVYCRDCGREVPAFEALDTFAREYERWIEHRNRARGEAEREAGRLEDLKRQVKNEKAKLKRAKEKTG